MSTETQKQYDILKEAQIRNNELAEKERNPQRKKYYQEEAAKYMKQANRLQLMENPVFSFLTNTIK